MQVMQSSVTVAAHRNKIGLRLLGVGAAQVLAHLDEKMHHAGANKRGSDIVACSGNQFSPELPTLWPVFCLEHAISGDQHPAEELVKYIATNS